MPLAMATLRRFTVQTFIVSLVKLMVAAHTPTDGQFVRTQVADGSVWADTWQTRGGTTTLRSTVRLCKADPSLRWVGVDVDGDGRQDVVAYSLEDGGRRLQVFRATDDGFVRIE
jgi:hypothetical protein